MWDYFKMNILPQDLQKGNRKPFSGTLNSPWNKFTLMSKQPGEIKGSLSTEELNPLSANFTEWSNTLKRFVGKLPTNCFSVFDHFVGLALKGLIKDCGNKEPFHVQVQFVRSLDERYVECCNSAGQGIYSTTSRYL